MKARYVGDAPVFLVDGRVLSPGDVIEIADHEVERPDFESVKEAEEDAGGAEAGLHRPGEAGL
jgi:hypothetical protein